MMLAAALEDGRVSFWKFPPNISWKRVHEAIGYQIEGAGVADQQITITILD